MEFTKYYCALGWQVFAVCRESNQNLIDTKANVISGLNVALDDCLTMIRNAIGDTKINLVINNAGILREERLGELNYHTIRKPFEVNSLGPLRVTEAVLGNLKNCINYQPHGFYCQQQFRWALWLPHVQGST